MKLVPWHRVTPRAPIQPLAPDFLGFVSELLQPETVTGDPIVCIVSLKFAAKGIVLLGNRSVPIEPAPLSDPL